MGPFFCLLANYQGNPAKSRQLTSKQPVHTVNSAVWFLLLLGAKALIWLTRKWAKKVMPIVISCVNRRQWVDLSLYYIVDSETLVRFV
jgi:hypothetical protein